MMKKQAAKKKIILIVEDNENNRELERDLFKVAGFKVLEAVDGANGVEIAKHSLPDCIIMDARLPDMSGIDAAKILLQDEKTQSIPVIFVTASVIGEYVEEIKSLDKPMYISKPINTRTFVSDIKKLLKSRPC